MREAIQAIRRGSDRESIGVDERKLQAGLEEKFSTLTYTRN